MSFMEVTDNELMYLLRCGNEMAKKVFIERYHYRLYGLIKRFDFKKLSDYLDYDDCFQECFIVFLKCIERFDEEYNFYNYLNRAINHHMIRLKKAKERNANVISLEYESDHKPSLIDIVSEDDLEYQNIVVDDYIKENFDSEEQEIIKLKSQGYSGWEISQIMNITVKYLAKKVAQIKEIMKNKPI